VEEKRSFPSDFQRRTLWRAVTGLAILTLGALLVGLVWLSSTVLGYLQPVLVPLAVAGIVAYLLDPVVRFLQLKGFSRIKGIITVFVGFLLFFGILFYFVGNKLSGQIKDVFDEDSGNSIGWMEPQTLRESKENGFYGWIMRTSFLKDARAFDARLENGGSITGPEKVKWRRDPETKALTNGENPPLRNSRTSLNPIGIAGSKLPTSTMPRNSSRSKTLV